MLLRLASFDAEDNIHLLSVVFLVELAPMPIMYL